MYQTIFGSICPSILKSCILIFTIALHLLQIPAQVDEYSGSKWQVVLEWLVLHWPVQMGALQERVRLFDTIMDKY